MESIPGAVRICAPPVSDLLGESNRGVGTVWTFVRYNVPRAPKATVLSVASYLGRKFHLPDIPQQQHTSPRPNIDCVLFYVERDEASMFA